MQDAVTTTISVGEVPDRPQVRDRLRAVMRNLFPFMVVGAIWEIVAWAEIFPRRLFPNDNARRRHTLVTYIN